MPARHRLLSLVALLCLTAVWLPPDAARSATKKSTLEDRALLVDQSHRYLVVPPGRSVTVWFDFQNTGSSTWTNADPNPVGLNTNDPMRRSSAFEGRKTNRTTKRKVSAWRAAWRPARVSQSAVQPGQTGRFRFAVTAPKKAGTYIERFAVVRGTDTRVPGGNAEFVIVVGQTASPDMVYRAKPKERTISLWVKPGERIYRPIAFQNTGYASWRSEGYGPTRLDLRAPTQLASQNESGDVRLESTPTVPKEIRRTKSATMILNATAPTVPGTYQNQIVLIGPYGAVDGSGIDLVLTVSDEPKPPLDSEPNVRVGVYAPSKLTATLTSDVPYDILRVDDGQSLGILAAGIESSVSFDPASGLYRLTTPTGSVDLPTPVRFVPQTNGLIDIKASSLKNFNRFRGTIEARYAPATKKLWLINELPIEFYLRGLAETSSVAPVEFAKTLVTAARSYALYHVFRNTKHADEFFHINSTTDQVYMGYGYELKTPNITEAVTATRGLVVTHPSMISDRNPLGFIVAAYSSCTDGRTRSFEERWGGAADLFPYLVSVPDPNGICTNPPYDNAAELLKGLDGNHMVGMSARGALRSIVNENATFDAMLKYYYSGVSLVVGYH